MKAFEMNGRRITDERLFRRQFSPLELLRQRELAAGFAAQALRPMSYANNFHSFQLYRAVWQELPSETADWRDYESEDLGGAMGEADRQLLQRLWDVLTEGGPATGETSRIFWILAAGYLMAGRTLEDIPLTRQAAEAAYRKVPEVREEPEFPPIPEKGDILLPARKKPYRLTLDPEEGQRRLEQGRRIIPRKLVPAPHRQGCTGIPVTLEIHRRPEDPAPEQIILPMGEYLFCNFVEEVPVFLHPTTVERGGTVMTREKDTITITHPGRETRTIDCTGREVVSFTPEEDGLHWLLADRERLDYRHYSLRNFYNSQLLWMDDVVEVALGQDDALLMLDSRGRVTALGLEDEPGEARYTSLNSLTAGGKGADGYADE